MSSDSLELNRGFTSDTHSAIPAYYTVLRELLNGGSVQQSRLGETRELLDATLFISDPTDCLPPVERQPNFAIGIAEGLQLVAGVSDARLMERITPNFRKYMDGSTFWGPYGVRAAGQLPRVVERLRTDHDSRQAVVTLWDPTYDLTPDRKDYPCTVSLTFRVRARHLELKTHMRSNDAWLGLPYDLMQFCILQCTVANVLGLPPGPYTHHVDSLHLYESNFNAARAFMVAPIQAQLGRARISGVLANTWPQAAERALLLLNGVLPAAPTTSEIRMHDIMRRYVDGG